MTGAILSPRELVLARFEWLSSGDFSAIYRSYHPEAQFRGHFPTEQDYRDFAREQGLAELELIKLQILDTARGRLAKVYSAQEYRFRGELHLYLDVTTLRSLENRWYVLHGKRVACAAETLSSPPTREAVEKHPQAVVY